MKPTIHAPPPVVEKEFPTGISFSAKGFLLAAFLTSGYFKSDPRFSWVPIDLTVLLAIALLATSAITLLVARLRLHRSVYWMAILLVLCSVPIFWTYWSPYAIEKVSRMYTLTALAMVSPFILFRTWRATTAFLYSLALVGLVICADAVVQLVVARGDLLRLTNATASTNGMGIISSITAISILVVGMETAGWTKAWLFVAGIAAALVMLGAGSRAEILGFLAAAGSLAVLRYRKRLKVWKLLLGLIGIFAAFAFLIDYLPELSRGRLLAMVIGDDALTTIAEESMRPMFWAAALASIASHPFGVGWGGFEAVFTGGYSGDAVRSFPHNILLEAFLEGGWLVGLWLVGMVYYATRHLAGRARASREYSAPILFGILIVVFVSALISGEWNDSRLMFSILSLALIDRGNRAPVLVGAS